MPATTAESAATTLLPPSGLFLELDRSGPIPLYYQIASVIEGAIADGTLPPGSRLENEVSLGERLGISRPTVRRAIQELVAKGLLVRRRGIGTQVVQRPMSRKVELTSLYEDLENNAQHPTTRLLLRETLDATAQVAQELAVTEGAPVLHIRRLRLSDGVPLAVLENYLPQEFRDVTEEDLQTHGLYQLMRARGAQISVAHQRIGARAATAPERTLLDIPSHGAVLTMERTAYGNDGRPIEFGSHCYRPDLYSFEVTLVNS
jgi:DNA-binding GntR family transcriptional regulator